MAVLTAPLKALIWINSIVLRLGRRIALICLMLMVVVILIQVVFRYLPMLDALPWPEEAARFLMLWMTGLIAPSAYRWGGFVAIDMVPRALPRVVGHVLALALFAVSLAVLVTAAQIGIKHVTSGCLFNSSTLWVPFTLELNIISPCKTEAFAWGGFEWARVKLAWMYLSLWLGMVLMIAVNIELVLRVVVALVDEDAALPDDPEMILAGSE